MISFCPVGAQAAGPSFSHTWRPSFIGYREAASWLRPILEGGTFLVQFDHIQKTYQSPNGEICALKDITFSVAEGDFVSIVGPSGCGKSTLLSLAVGLEQPSGGQVYLDGQPASQALSRMGYMPQRDELFPWRSIWANVTLGLEIRGQKDDAHLQRVETLLNRYGLSGFRDKLPGQLSGGMRQRCALIRTLATDPGLLLLDEPFSALDYQTRLHVSDDIHAMIRQEKKTAILVTHDISESVSMSDQVVVLSARPGRVKAVHDLSEFKGLSPMERREHPHFARYFNSIWKELEH